MRSFLFAGRIRSRIVLAVLLAVSYGCSADPKQHLSIFPSECPSKDREIKPRTVQILEWPWDQ